MHFGNTIVRDIWIRNNAKYTILTIDNSKNDKGYDKNIKDLDSLNKSMVKYNKEHRNRKDPVNAEDILIRPMPEWYCPTCGAESVIQRISKFENIIKCEECGWQRDHNFT